HKQKDEEKFYANYKLALEAIQYKEQKKALSYLNKCIQIENDRIDLYEMRGLILLSLKKYNNALNDFKKIIEYEPLHSEVDRYWQSARFQKAEKVTARTNRLIAITNALNAVNTSIITSINTTMPVKSPTNYNVIPNATSSGSRTTQETCSHCNGTGVNPVATSSTSFGGSHYCNVCKKEVSDSHGYHGSCPSCNGKGYRIKIR
ncbi:MAG: hypothetical protein LBU22_00355, partial [Dysgonamonadaceae bacterium]|nr:hypothetical protein [Dysgonamonadaceae bacterium]